MRGGRQGFLHPCFLILFAAQLGSSSRSLLALGSSTCRGGGALINVSFCSFTDYETGIMLHDKCSYTDAHILSLSISHTYTITTGCLMFVLFFLILAAILVSYSYFPNFDGRFSEKQENLSQFLCCGVCNGVSATVFGWSQQSLTGRLVTALDFHFYTAILSLYQW